MIYFYLSKNELLKSSVVAEPLESLSEGEREGN